MMADKALAHFRVAPGSDGDVRQEKGRTQKFLTVEVHSPRRKRSDCAALVSTALVRTKPCHGFLEEPLHYYASVITYPEGTECGLPQKQNV